MSTTDELCELLSGVTVRFGLVAQGHEKKIKAMLSEGADWETIGKAIGWHPPTAKKHWEYLMSARRQSVDVEILPHNDNLTHEITWAECPQCGGSDLIIKASNGSCPDGVWDCDPWACQGCGCIGDWVVDENTAYPRWAEEEPQADEKYYNAEEWSE